MATIALPAPQERPIPVPVAGWLLVASAAFVLYVLLQENGAVLAQHWETVHELFHDGRHALGVPCH
jgi:hypothetical protein